jgi:D-alanyl-D-alanine carboxypeptidase (penicillin-binding protein 5/6)
MRLPVWIFVTLLPVSAGYSTAKPRFQSTAPIAYVVDMASGRILLNENGHKQIPPASMAKMMTAYVVFDLIQRGKLDANTKFRVRPAIWKRWNNTGSSMFLKANEDVRVSDLLHGLISLSGNDAAIVLAEGVAGSEAAFTKQMNKAAAQIGMRNSHFATANGWPDAGKTRTTAQDLALLGARTIRDFPTLYHRFYGETGFAWNNIRQVNRNPILGVIDGADGMKTGHTSEAGYCFTGTAQQGGRRVMMVVAGLGSVQARASESARVMRWAFQDWRTERLYSAKARVMRLPVQMGNSRSVVVSSKSPVMVTLPRGEKDNYTLFVRYTGPLKAPIKRGTQVAQLVAKFEDGTEQIMPLLAHESVAPAGFFMRAYNGLLSLVAA